MVLIEMKKILADVPTTYDPEDFIDVMDGSIQGYIDEDDYGYYGRVYHGMLFGKKTMRLRMKLVLRLIIILLTSLDIQCLRPTHLGEVQIHNGLGFDTIGTPENPKAIKYNIIINKVPHYVFIRHNPGGAKSLIRLDTIIKRRK